jgi:DNA-binding FadR family transcriptional regulator
MSEPAAAEVEVPKAAELIAAQLRRQIVMGDRAEGDLLPPEHKLMMDLGVSRPTLRQAVRILESEHLVRVYRGRNGGTRISRPSAATAGRYLNNLLIFQGASRDDVHRAQLLLEPAAVAQIAADVDDQTVTALRDAVERNRRESDPSRSSSLRSDFHVQLVKLTNNRSLTLFVLLLTNLLDIPLKRRRPEPADEVPEIDLGFLDAHSRVIDLIEAGASRKASRHWHQHLQAMHARLRETMDTGAVLDLEA